MNKKTQSIFSLVAGCIAALVALFSLISGIIWLTRISFDDVQYGIYVIVSALANLAAAAGLTFCGVKLIIGFTKKADEPKFVQLLAVVFFAFQVVLQLLYLFIFIDMIAYLGVTFWLVLIVGVAGLVCSLVALFAKFDAKSKNIFNMVVSGIGFVFAILILAQGGLETLALVSNIFVMIMFAVTFTYFLFGLLIDNKGGNSEPAKEVEEPKAEDAAE